MAGSAATSEVLVLDCDGILTDGGLYVGADGAELKRFSIFDGAGIKAACDVGLPVAVVSGHASEATVRRLRQLGVTDVAVGVRDKLAAFEEILGRRGLAAARAAAMGDDLMDLPMLRRAGFSATVPAAHEQVLKEVDYVTQRAGGRGAVREVIELILQARGLWDDLLARFVP